jgi:hypothetical protein
LNVNQIGRVEKILKCKGILERFKPNHEESSCMKNKIDLMEHVIQHNNIGNFIPEGVKKQKEEYPTPKKGNHHAIIAINSSSNSSIIDYSASHHMEAKEEFFTSFSS